MTPPAKPFTSAKIVPPRASTKTRNKKARASGTMRQGPRRSEWILLSCSREASDPGGTRTHDHSIKSAVLYRLSYRVIQKTCRVDRRETKAANDWSLLLFVIDRQTGQLRSNHFRIRAGPKQVRGSIRRALNGSLVQDSASRLRVRPIQRGALALTRSPTTSTQIRMELSSTKRGSRENCHVEGL